MTLAQFTLVLPPPHMIEASAGPSGSGSKFSETLVAAVRLCRLAAQTDAKKERKGKGARQSCVLAMGGGSDGSAGVGELLVTMCCWEHGEDEAS